MPDFTNCSVQEAVSYVFDYYDLPEVLHAMFVEFGDCASIYDDKDIIRYYRQLAVHCLSMAEISISIDEHKGSHASNSQKANSGS